MSEENKTNVKKWFVFHDIVSYWQQGNLVGKQDNFIGNEVEKSGWLSRLLSRLLRRPSTNRKPLTDDFAKIKRGDIVVYYARDVGLVTDLFQVDSDIEYKKDHPYWHEVKVFRIKHLMKLPEGYYLNFKKLVKDSTEKDALKAFPDISELEHGGGTKVCIPFDEDYSKLEQSLSDIRYITKMDGPTGWHVDADLLCGLLDYYNSRATSFVSLLIASVFGIVTLSAIIQFVSNSVSNSLQALSIFDAIPLILSGFLYFLFAFAGYHTLTTYSYYAGIAERIRELGFIRPHLEELNKLRYTEQVDKVTRISQDFSLYDFITKRDTIHAKSLSKRILSKAYLFKIFYVLALIALAVVVYWKSLTFLPQIYLYVIVAIIVATLTIYGARFYIQKHFKPEDYE